MDVEQWLRGLGFGQYAQAFAENDIDFAVLPDLSDGRSSGTGRRFPRPSQTLAGRDHRARRGLGANHATLVAAPPGERRQVTILFADLSGFTALRALGRGRGS